MSFGRVNFRCDFNLLVMSKLGNRTFFGRCISPTSFVDKIERDFVISARFTLLQIFHTNSKKRGNPYQLDGINHFVSFDFKYNWILV